ncbi:MAG: hypothetical protein K2V38_27840, partial [Gemmataceae bacterium]|nr:hypothetical protein [Gemmataceae bacterium]
PGIGPDYFSVRWTGQIEARYSEEYTFTMVGDDRLRLVVNGQTVINRQFYSPDEFRGTIALEAGRRYDIEVTMAEDFGGAGARLWWQSASQTREIVPAAQLFPTSPYQAVTVRTGTGRGADTRLEIQDGGLRGEYFSNPTLSGTPTVTRTDGNIDFFWNDSPIRDQNGTPIIPADNFSVRWTGFVLPQFTEDYTFSALPDDVFRLWVNDQLILDRQTFSTTEIDSIPIRLTAGVPARIRVDYVETGGPGTAVLLWRSPSTVKNFPTYLQPEFPDLGGGDTTGTINRLGFSFAASMMGLRFDLAGVDLANNRIIGSGLSFTVAAPSGDEVSRQTIAGVNATAANQLWAETGPGRVRWATFPGNAGGNYAYAGRDSTPLGTMLPDNTGFQLNNRQDATLFQSDALTQFLQAYTGSTVSFIVKREIQNFFGDFNVYTKEFQDGSFAPGLRLTLAPKVTAAPLAVDLLAAFDTGTSNSDDLTSLNNTAPGSALRFSVTGTTPGAVVTVYADGVAIGSAVATGTTTQVLTRGDRRLADGVRAITARQTVLGVESADSAALAVTVDTTTPRGTVAAVASPRNTAVDTIAVTFSEPVTGVDLSDFALNGNALNLTAATLSGSGATYTIGNLAGLTAAEGVYSLVLLAGGSGIGDAAGNLLLANAISAWAVDLTAPRPAIGSVTPALRNAPVASVSITFTEPVRGFDIGDLGLTLNGAPVPLAGATLSGSGAFYTLGNLTGLTGAEGDYVLVLNPTGSGVTDLAGIHHPDGAVAALQGHQALAMGTARSQRHLIRAQSLTDQ